MWRTRLVLRGKFMRRVSLACGVLCLLAAVARLMAISTDSSKPIETIPVSQIHAGMKGVAYTVFQGTKPEAMGVEVLGILKNVNGPKGDVILVRLSGAKAEYTGVVAGMSGSPVYLDGKLAGALAFRIGEFSKEPIAGVTPIAEMLEINAMDKSPENHPDLAKVKVTAASKTSGPGTSPALREFCQRYSAHRNSARLQRLFAGCTATLCPATGGRWDRSGHGRGLGQRRQTAGAA